MIFLSLHKVDAVVIKTMEFKENDKLVWLYTDKFGKITSIAKGARKVKVNFYLLLYLYVMGNMYYLKERIYIIYKRVR